MSLADIKKRAGRRETTYMVLRGEISTPVAKAPEGKTDMRRRQHIFMTPTGPEGRWFPGFLDLSKPIMGSPEAQRALEEARAKWRQERGEKVDRT